MTTLFSGDVHAGLSGFELGPEIFPLGEGIFLTKTYAHLMAPFMLAFKPAPIGEHHPAPWKSAQGGFSFDINAELFIPADIENKFGAKIGIAKTIVFLLRLNINPATTLSIFSNYKFAALSQSNDNEVKLLPFEIQPRHFPLGISGGIATTENLNWVKERWQVTYKLMNESAEFNLAVEAIDKGQFIESSALALVSLCAAIEALFSPSISELKFRVSSLVASFLEPAGIARHNTQKNIAKLYDKRSAAAHGKPKHESEDLLATFNLLRQVLFKIIDDGKVPTKEELEALLFGSLSSN